MKKGGGPNTKFSGEPASPIRRHKLRRYPGGARTGGKKKDRDQELTLGEIGTETLVLTAVRVLTFLLGAVCGHSRGVRNRETKKKKGLGKKSRLTTGTVSF